VLSRTSTPNARRSFNARAERCSLKRRHQPRAGLHENDARLRRVDPAEVMPQRLARDRDHDARELHPGRPATDNHHRQVFRAFRLRLGQLGSLERRQESVPHFQLRLRWSLAPARMTPTHRDRNTHGGTRRPGSGSRTARRCRYAAARCVARGRPDVTLAARTVTLRTERRHQRIGTAMSLGASAPVATW
jgi:hypothetical protein